MKEYYVVVTTFDDRGKVTANIVDVVEAEQKPEQGYKSTKSKDICQRGRFQLREKAEDREKKERLKP